MGQIWGAKGKEVRKSKSRAERGVRQDAEVWPGLGKEEV